MVNEQAVRNSNVRAAAALDSEHGMFNRGPSGMQRERSPNQNWTSKDRDTMLV